MSPSTIRRLSLAALVFALAFPPHAAAAPWPLEDLIGRVRGFFSSIWTPSGCELMPDGRCGAAPNLIYRENGCVLEPDGRCKG